MKTKFTFIALIFSASVLASDGVQVAPKEVLNEYIESCKQYALEDGIPKAELNTYLLECVNEDLESNGYQKVETLDDES